MAEKKPAIAIVGGGIVGATAAYYLAREDYSVTLFDSGEGQATTAAAGIICPWFTKRRNKEWYYLVSNGAEFYRQFMQELADDGFPTDEIFEEEGALLLKKNKEDIALDLEKAPLKLKDSPSIGSVQPIAAQHVKNYYPLLESPYDATYVSGGARVSGRKLIQILKEAIQFFGGRILPHKASLVKKDSVQVHIKCQNKIQAFDKVLLAAGAWLPQLLEPLNLTCEITPQKGQLFSIYKKEWANKHWPVIMPPGGFDIIPFNNGELVIGASHEKDKGYDLILDRNIIEDLYQKAQAFIPAIKDLPIHRTEVGIRAYTPDAGILVGRVPLHENLWAISGLGASGLTSGPFLAYQWVEGIKTGKSLIDSTLFSAHSYIYPNK